MNGILNNLWPKNTTLATKTKDIILVIGFIVAAAGWFRSSVIENSQTNSEITILKNEVKTLTLAVSESTKQLEKVNETLLKQNELNGKIILFMELKK